MFQNGHTAPETAFKKGSIPWNKMKKYPNLKLSGKNHWNWQGGKTQKYKYQQASRPKPDLCEICGAMGIICFDHNHVTGNFRGWICKRCNVILGFAGESTELLNALIEYLKKCPK